MSFVKSCMSALIIYSLILTFICLVYSRPRPFAGELSRCPLKFWLNILELVHRRYPCLYAAKVLRLTHTQGRAAVALGNSPALRVVIPGQALLSVCHSRTLQAV